MTQFYSRNDVNYSGDVYSIPFDYIDKKEVKVYIDDELWTKWHFLNKHQLTLDEVPEDIRYSNIISVRRETDIEEKVVTYDNNSLLNKENLNKSQDQLLFAVQEIYDNNVQFQSDIREEVDEKVERVSDAVEKLEFLEDSVEIANEAALEATEQAQIATEKAEETLNTYNEAMAEIDTLRQNSIEDIGQLVADHTNDLNSLEATIKKDADAILNRVGFNMFDTVIKDHILTYEESKGLALQGTWVYKEAIAGERFGYPDFYTKCLEEYNEATATETVNGVTVKVHSNGHKFYNIVDKTAIDELFNAMGSAWMYGVDTANERIFLPRNNYFEQVTSDTSKVGQSVEAGLPNITGSFDTSNDAGNCVGAFARLGTSKSNQGASKTGGSNVDFNASRSNPIYGNSMTVQPPAVKKLLYICVGNTVADTSWVDVVTQVEGSVKDLEDKTLEGIERLRQSSTALTQNQITNCLLEVPQNIKLELNNGALTLKAGSKVVVPNGYQANGTDKKYEHITITKDLKIIPSTSFATGAYFIAYNWDGNYLTQGMVSTATSGGTAPTGNHCLWYNTTNNVVDRTNGSATLYNQKMSFPIAVAQVVNGVAEWTAIDQVFNGFGYIGSTIWVDKEVSELIANGRNTDGTLNNIEYTTKNVITRTFTGISGNISLYLGDNFFTYSVGGEGWVFDEEANYYVVGSAKEKRAVVEVVTCTMNNDVIFNFQPKQPFRAINYSDKDFIAKWGMPSSKYVDLTLGASTTQYKAPANGYFFLSKTAKASGQYAYFQNYSASDLSVEYTTSSSTGTAKIYIPVKKGDIVRLEYNLTGATNYFRFIYAEGEV